MVTIVTRAAKGEALTHAEVDANFTNLNNGKEPSITAGTTSQYWRGDKSWRDFFTDVRATTLTGLSTATNAVVAAADTVLSAMGKLQKQVSDNLTSLMNHIGDTNNPHGLTKSQIGLGNVDNTSDANKPISTATQTALNAKLNASEVGISVAQLVGGTVPAAQLPSYVDDVLEYANTAAFPTTGESGKIYVAIDTGKTYRWGGSAYAEISASPGSTDAVPEGATNKYFTESRVRAAVLTGLSTVTNAAIAATDSILAAFGKLQAQVTDLYGIKANVNNTALTGTTTAVNVDISTMLEIPVWTTATRPANGDGRIGYNSDLKAYEGCNNGTWASLGGGATGAPSNYAFYENDTNVTGNYTITTGKNAMSAGPITINSGVQVTIPTGSRYIVV